VEFSETEEIDVIELGKESILVFSHDNHPVLGETILVRQYIKQGDEPKRIGIFHLPQSDPSMLAVEALANFVETCKSEFVWLIYDRTLSNTPLKLISNSF